MKLLFFCVCILSSGQSFAGIILGPGAFASGSSRSIEKDANNANYLKTNAGFGLAGDFEVILYGPLSVNLGLQYVSSSAEVQYDYNLPPGALSDGKATDLETQASQFYLTLGPRIRFLNLSGFKAYIGGGLVFGNIVLVYDKQDFKSKTSNTNGFEDSESQSFEGSYLEGGIEIGIHKNNAIRVAARKLEVDAKKFETLNNSELTYDFMTFSVQYLHYFDWNFFFK